MMARHGPAILWTGLWLVVMIVALVARPFLPVDETRYLAVAWEMWLGGDYLVPHLNGETYSHKPPLLFWLINAGWGVFGVNDWWPRLVAPMTGLASLFLSARLARELWPEIKDIANTAPLLLFGGLFWTIFTTLTMFDMLLTLFTLVGLIGVLRAARGRMVSGFLLLGIGIGLGALTKGPAILLHTLPVALLAPWWGGTGSVRKGPWYAGVFAAVILGVAIGLAWAIPAGMNGGEAYREAIFWGQSAGRIVSSFAHQQPWWFYLAALPVLLLPWAIWPPVWRALRRLNLGDGGVRFCIAWLAPAVLVFSAISGKQFHYLLPELPAIALVMAWGLLRAGEEKASRFDLLLPGLLAVLVGGALYALPALPLPVPPPWLDLVATGWGGFLAAAGVAVMVAGGISKVRQICVLGALSAAFVITTHMALKPVLATVYDLKPVAERLAKWQEEGIPLANFSKYHGQYQFLGRLEKPIAQVGMLSPDTQKFIEANPQGLIIAYHEKLPGKAAPIAVYRFRSRLIAIWPAKTVKEFPGITERSSPK
ncbi:MAG: glycosyltransferase family 39 protein [Proteobacteria bacterium]|nr:glycosyltransferase family 39 protein [Pseudomonadota bacterium]MDA1023166.1 glycosyltransferase family 39 protein [Pseudomonadota bacterium]